MSRVIVLLIPDDAFAWDILDVASEQPQVERALMVNPDHPQSIAELIEHTS